MATATKQPTLVRAMQFLKKNGIKGLATNKELEAYLKKHGVPIAHREPMNNGDSIWCVESELAGSIKPPAIEPLTTVVPSQYFELLKSTQRIQAATSDLKNLLTREIGGLIRVRHEDVEAFNNLYKFIEEQTEVAERRHVFVKDALAELYRLHYSNVSTTTQIAQKLGLFEAEEPGAGESHES